MKKTLMAVIAFAFLVLSSGCAVIGTAASLGIAYAVSKASK